MDNNGEAMMGNNFIYIFGLLLLFGMMNGGFGFGGNRGPMMPPDLVTTTQMQQGFDNQQTQGTLQQLLVGTANNNYETAQLINAQTNALMQQNYTNQINAVQGFNQVNMNIQNQTNVLSQMLQALSAKVDSCCCEIKTQMLQNRLDDAQAALVSKNNDISNYNQSNYLLGQLGRFVAWAGTGAPAAAAAA